MLSNNTTMNQTSSATAKAGNARDPSNATTTSDSALVAASSSSQPSIVIYFSTHNTIRVGYDNVPQPRHIAELPSTPNTMALAMPRSLKDAEVIFQNYSSSIERLIHLLGGASPNAAASTNSSSNNSNSSRHFKNRYVILHDFGIYLNRYWKLAIMRILYDVCNATYLKFLSTIEMIPFSVVSPSTMTLTDDGKGSTSSTSTSVVLSIHISSNAAQCMIYANGHHLEYTYQSCDYCDSDGTDDAIGMVDDLRKRQERWLLSTTSPLIYAIALCLEKCPVSIRKDVVQNLYFSGTILVHAFQERVVLLLYELLTGDANHSHTNTSVEQTATTSTSDANDQVTRMSPNTTMLVQFTQIPISRTMLRPLAPYIAMIEHNNKDSGSDFKMNSTSRTTELIPWLGVTIYSSYWHYHEQHQDMISSSRISPSTNEAERDGMSWIDVTTTLSDPWNKRD